MPALNIESGKTGHWEWKRLREGGATMEFIPARGGLLSRWEIERDGQPLSVFWFRPGAYDEDPAGAHRLPGGMPALFPCCGPTLRDGVEGKYLVDGEAYIIDKHGFAPTMAWNFDGATATDDDAVTATLSLTDTERTREQYPFAFEVRVAYTLRGRTLRTEWDVENRSEREMPIGPGLHPYFRLPMTEAGSRGDCELVTRARSHFIFNPETNCWTGETEPLTSGAVRFGQLESDASFMMGDLDRPEYVVKDPAANIAIRATWPAPATPDGGPFLNNWTLDDEVDFYCVEPFMTPTNGLNNGRGLIRLAPGEHWRWWFELEVI